MKRLIAKATGLIVLTLIFGVTSTMAAEPIRIGAISSISGWAGSLGSGQKQAFEALTKNINDNGGVLGRPIEIILEDDKSVPTNALLAATKLVKDKKVCALIGPTITDSGMAIIPMAEREKVPFIVIAPIVAPMQKWIFLLGPGDIRPAEHLVEYAVKSLGSKRIALIHDTANYGSTGAGIVKKTIKNYPEAKIVITETLNPGDTSVVPQLAKIKAAKPDLLITYVAGEPATVIAKNYKQLGMNVQVLAPGAVPMPGFLKVAGSIADEAGWIFMGFSVIVAENLPIDDPWRVNIYNPFKKILQNTFGEKAIPNIFHVGAADGVMITVEAIKHAGSDDPAAIRNALEEIKYHGFLGPYGATPTDHQGSQKDEEIMMKFQGGRMLPYSK